jgi:hypothetical protein
MMVFRISEQITKGNIIGGDNESAWIILESLKTEVDKTLTDTATVKEIKIAIDEVEVLLARVTQSRECN